MRNSLVLPVCCAFALTTLAACGQSSLSDAGQQTEPDLASERDGGADGSADLEPLGPATGGMNPPLGCTILSPYGLSGQAPFTAHVNALDAACVLGAGDLASASLEWNFGDASANARFNELQGFSAAHLYDLPGDYIITLRITNELGGFNTFTTAVHVAQSTRTQIYLAANGDDLRDGLSEQTSVQTLARANQLLASDRELLLRRGDSFPCPASPCIDVGDHTNVHVTSYGEASAAKAELHHPAGSDTGGMLRTGDAANQIVFENLILRSDTVTPLGGNNSNAPRGLSPQNASNLTLRGIDFRKLDDATNGGARGELLLDNSADVLGGYFVIGGGIDGTYLGNTVDGSHDQHNFRVYMSRQLYYGNTLRGASSSSIAMADGEYHYAAHNLLEHGWVRLGYQGSSYSAVRFAVFDSNRFVNVQGITIHPGQRDVFFRNNITVGDTDASYGLWGQSQTWPWQNGGVTQNVKIINNTWITNQPGRRFAELGMGHGSDANIVLANNLFVHSDSGMSNSNIDVHEIDDPANPLAGLVIHNNVWHAALGFGVSGGTDSLSEWNAYPEVEPNDAVDTVTLTCTAVPQMGDCAPEAGSIAATSAAPYPGVRFDHWGRLRPMTGAWSAGAVEPQ